VLYKDEDRLVLKREERFQKENWYTEIAKSPMALISEPDQRYQTDINVSMLEDEGALNPEIHLMVDPGAIDYYLDPGQEADIKPELGGEIVSNGESIPVTVCFEAELYGDQIDTILQSNFYDPSLEAMAEGSATVRLEENPVENLRDFAI